jgi:hypothetical protein
MTSEELKALLEYAGDVGSNQMNLLIQAEHAHKEARGMGERLAATFAEYERMCQEVTMLRVAIINDPEPCSIAGAILVIQRLRRELAEAKKGKRTKGRKKCA